jgi:hypothetical protein
VGGEEADGKTGPGNKAWRKVLLAHLEPYEDNRISSPRYTRGDARPRTERTREMRPGEMDSRGQTPSARTGHDLVHANAQIFRRLHAGPWVALAQGLSIHISNLAPLLLGRLRQTSPPEPDLRRPRRLPPIWPATGPLGQDPSISIPHRISLVRMRLSCGTAPPYPRFLTVARAAWR